MSPFVSVVIVPSAVMFKSPTLTEPAVNAPEIVVAPVVETSAVVNVPVTFNVSAIVTAVESLESNVVPFTLNALITTSPVQLGWI